MNREYQKEIEEQASIGVAPFDHEAYKGNLEALTPAKEVDWEKLMLTEIEKLRLARRTYNDFNRGYDQACQDIYRVVRRNNSGIGKRGVPSGINGGNAPTSPTLQVKALSPDQNIGVNIDNYADMED